MRRLTLDYLKTESGSGLVLAAAAVAALGLANSRVAADYFSLLAAPTPLQIGAFSETMSPAGPTGPLARPPTAPRRWRPWRSPARGSPTRCACC
jgi:hypothetical protein